MRVSRVLLLGVLFAGLLTGCGGGGGARWPISGDGRLQSGDATAIDGSYVDDVTFTPPHSGSVTVTMSSSSIDPYVVLYAGTNDSNRLGSDDDSGPGLDARYTFYATGGVTYMARFTTYGSGAKTGSYSYTIDYAYLASPAYRQSDSAGAGKRATDDNTKLQNVR